MIVTRGAVSTLKRRAPTSAGALVASPTFDYAAPPPPFRVEILNGM